MTDRCNAACLFCVLVCLTFAATNAAQTPSAPLAVPLNAIDAILDAFKSHSIVALGEGPHGNHQGHAFRVSLIRDPRFAAIVNDIVIESGNALYQNVIDRFVLGETVPDDTLKQVWRNTTQPHEVWDRTTSEDFLRAVRELNRLLAPDRRLRVWAGDPPVDWDRLANPRDVWDAWMPLRDSHPAELIRREVLARGRRALVVYGDEHLRHQTGPASARSLVARLEADASTRVFSIRTAASEFDRLDAIQPNVMSWPVPSVALIRGTTLGVASSVLYSPPGAPDGPAMDQLYDAVLYLGDRRNITLAPFPAGLCADEAYIAMRTLRTGDAQWPMRFQAQCKDGR